VSQYSLDWVAFEDLGDLGEGGGDFVVGASRADQTVSNLGSIVRSANHVCGTTSGRVLGRSANEDSGGGLRDEAVNLNAQITDQVVPRLV